MYVYLGEHYLAMLDKLRGDAVCSVEDCGEPVLHENTDLCKRHWRHKEKRKIRNWQRVCEVGGCERRVHARDMCDKHYRAWRRNPTVSEHRRCRVSWCFDPVCARDLCSKHYMAWKRDPKVVEHDRCMINGCGKPMETGSLCNTHYKRMRRLGSAIAPVGEHTKLTATQVRQIRAARWMGESYVSIAKRHGISRNNVWNVCAGRDLATCQVPAP